MSLLGGFFSSLNPINAIKNTTKDVFSAPSWGKFWDSFGNADPVTHLAVDAQSRLDDNATAKLAGGLGFGGVRDYFQHAADDPTQGALHHALVGLAYLGASGAASGAFGGAEGDAAASAGGGTAMGNAAGTLGAADSSAASSQLGLTAADVGGTSGATANAAASGGSLLGGLSTQQEIQLGLSAASLAKSAFTPAPSLPTPPPPAQMPNGPESQGYSATQALMAGAGQAGGAPGVAQTLLNGAGGVDPNTLGLGRNILLGS